MSKQELEKWKNKLNLYLKLHYHDVQLMNCKVCPFGTAENHITHNRKGCPETFLAMLEDDAGTLSLFETMGDPNLTKVSYCVEWIKYV